jgi:CheY-like chemotaxis protein
MTRSGALADILLFDDDDDVREIVRLALQRKGDIRVRECNSGTAAVDAVRAQLPDLILLDVMMPGMDGPATLAELRQLGCRLPPVFFLTAKTMPSEVARLLQLGASRIIAKPFDPLQLLQAVKAGWEQTIAA